MKHHGAFRRGIVLALLIGFYVHSAAGAQTVPQEDLQGELQAVPPGWRIETVDDGHIIEELGQHSLAYDSLGNPHIAYGGDHLYHATRNAGNWVIEVIDSSPRVGKNASIAVDSLNYIYISYYDETNQDLKYATNWPDWGWHVSTLATNGDVGAKSRIFASSGGQGPELNLAFLDSTAHKVWFTYAGEETLGAWALPEPVSGTLNTSNFAMAMWGAQPRFSIYASGGIYYGYYSGASWQQELVDSGPCSSFTDIAVDKTGIPYIPISAYVDVNFWETYLAYKTQSGWVYPSDPDPSSLILSYGDPPPDNLSMSYDPVWNRVFLVMQLPQTYNAVNNSMVIMTGLQHIFDEQKVYPNLITNVPGNRFPSIAIANYKELKAGTVYVYGGALHYQFLSTLDDTTWNSSITPVDTSSSRGDCNILKSDGGGSLSVMYQRGDTGALYFKRSTAAGWASTFTVTDTGEWAACGQYDRPSMDLLSDGTAAAAYVTTTGNLIYAKWYCPPIGRCGFDHETVDTGLSAGSGGSTALAIGKVDNPNILYHKSGHLRFAYKTTPSALNWTIIAVDDTLDTYGPLSLETDKDGKLHAAYLSTMDYPYYARFGFGGNYWSAITQLENSSFTWDPLHVAVNSVTNLPQVSYDLEKKLILRTYACTILNCNWYSLTVDTPTDPSGLLKEISFAIDSKGKRSFAYFYSSPLQGEKGVKLMQVDGSINTSFMIQNGASIGDTSIALRPGDVPVIAYHVPGLGQLRVAWGPNRVFLPLIRR